VEDPIVDSGILHGGKGGDVEWWLEPRNKCFYLWLLYCLNLLIYHSSILADQYSSQ